MTDSISKHERNLSAAIHASTLSRFFIPFGNILLPLVLWMANKKDYAFVDYNGKQALNFQISLFLYSAVFGLISLPFFFGIFPGLFDHGFFNPGDWDRFGGIDFDFDWGHGPFRTWFVPLGIAGFMSGVLFIINIVYTILATIRTNEGQTFKYPITINFIK